MYKQSKLLNEEISNLVLVSFPMFNENNDNSHIYINKENLINDY